MISDKIRKIRNVIFNKPYSFYFIFFFFLFIILNIIVNQVYLTTSTLLHNLKFGIPFVFFNFLIASLIAININLIIVKFNEYKEINGKEGGLTFLGVFGGILGGACPGCFVGLFPAFIGLFGISASLSVLPLYGIEIQIISSLLLIVSVYLLTENNVCKIK